MTLRDHDLPMTTTNREGPTGAHRRPTPATRPDNERLYRSADRESHPVQPRRLYTP